MDVSEIQKAVLDCLRSVGVPRVLVTTIYALSDEPAEVDVARVAKQDTFFVEFVATREEFEQFRECANAKGVWIRKDFRPFDKAGRFSYAVIAVEMRR